jgi:hypothetical protein
MMHLVISCSSYLLFFAAKALMPTPLAAWRSLETHSNRLPKL